MNKITYNAGSLDRGCTKHVPINGAARPDSVHDEDRLSLCQEFTMEINAAIVLQLHREDRHYHHQQQNNNDS